jgi:hypothetical protein
MSKNISLEDLAKLLGQAKPETKVEAKEKKARKKVDRSAQDIEAMKAKMFSLREKAKQKREERVNYVKQGMEEIHKMEKETSLEIKKMSEKDAEELFERKYGSKIEKIDETIVTIKSSLDEMKEAKKQKALDKLKAQLLEKAEPKPMETNKLSQANNSTINIQTPTPQTNNNNTSNQPTHISHQPIPPVNSNPNRIPKIPNYRNLFRK